MRVGLVFGSGGPVAHGFACGALAAIEDRTGWDPRTADLVVGTSAGAQVAALLRAGMSSADLRARATGRVLSAEGATIAQHYVRPDHPLSLWDLVRRPIPAAPLAAARSLLQPWRIVPGRLWAALAPEGSTDLAPQAEGLGALFGSTWAASPLWVVAMELESGRRTVFGRPEAPDAAVGEAVIASGSVPGVCRPVMIDRRRYVDGGLVSTTNLDVVAGADLDLVVVFSALTGHSPNARGPHAFRRALRQRLSHEEQTVLESGITVVVLEPTPGELDLHGLNVLDSSRLGPVTDAAYAAVDASFDIEPGGLEALAEAH